MSNTLEVKLNVKVLPLDDLLRNHVEQIVGYRPNGHDIFAVDADNPDRYFLLLNYDGHRAASTAEAKSAKEGAATAYGLAIAELVQRGVDDIPRHHIGA